MDVERAQTPSGMVYVPGGNAILGTNDPEADEDVKPARHKFVPSFYIDRTAVTNAEFRKFHPDFDFPANEANLPATNITYTEAEAYAVSVGKRLPTEEEWEKAARGTDGRRYPWGNQWDPQKVAKRAHRGLMVSQADTVLTLQRVSSTSQLKLQPGALKPGQCAIGPSRVQPVGSVPAGISPYGCMDMAGNSWQWVQGFYNGDKSMRILRGGAVGYGERSMRTYHRAIEGEGST